mmetsp:Transcript_9100/g.13462  ORF Transcript_9100/g.13462 Transcript_9100/m.13462 type:complete len:98 (+) Transcript_9100:51-344(+)
MPWQAAPPLLIIGGAFAVAGAGLTGIDYLTYGKKKEFSYDKWSHFMNYRDDRLQQEVAAMQKAISTQTAEEKALRDEFNKQYKKLKAEWAEKQAKSA